MTFDDLLDRLYLFDFEVTVCDWLLVIQNYKTDEEFVFHNSTCDEINSFIQNKKPIFIGHNARYYDQYILKGILSGYDNYQIKKINDHIINGGQGFELEYDYTDKLAVWDTMQDIVPQKSLKEIEANLLMDITETTVDFDIDRAWTEEEYDRMLYYCRKDVQALKPLFNIRKGYFETKFDICLLSNIDPIHNIGLTNAKLCAKFLEAEMVTRDDERDYEIPSTIDTTVINPNILDFFSQIKDDNISSEELFKKKLTVDIHGVSSVVAWGGLHSAIKNCSFDTKNDNNYVIVNADFASLYPHLLALPQYNFISRNIKDKNKYYETLQRRLELKHQGKKKEQLALKLILNTTYGCLLNRYNQLYDPKNSRSTCITGQLLISELTEKIYKIGDVDIIQINTDGVMVKIPKNKLDEYYKVCNDFSKKCGIELEYDLIDKIIQRDVNNYIMVYGDEKHKSIKAKGGCFGSLPKLSIKEDGTIESEYEINFKSNSLAIVSEALARFLLNGTLIEDTINNCQNKAMFQVVSHLGSTYEKCVQESPNGDILLQRNNRIYAGKKSSGTIIKIKPDSRRDSLANCPTNPLVDNGNVATIDDINKQWYIDLAKQWAEDFKGIKRLEEYKKQELLELAKQYNIDYDKKIKKSTLIELIKKVKKEGDNIVKKRGNNFKDISGNRYGHLVVIGLSHTGNKTSYWKCKCDCGNDFIRAKGSILVNKINSCNKCDLIKKEKHHMYCGDSSKNAPNNRLYHIWRGMKSRCYYIKHKHYRRYGGRGIKVCNDWLNNYLLFKEWSLNNGYKDNLTIDRIDVDGNYCPENCRWVTMLEQQKNTSKVIKIQCYGKTYTLNEFCKKYHTTYQSVHKYIINGKINVEDFVKLCDERSSKHQNITK